MHVHAALKVKQAVLFLQDNKFIEFHTLSQNTQQNPLVIKYFQFNAVRFSPFFRLFLFCFSSFHIENKIQTNHSLSADGELEFSKGKNNNSNYLLTTFFMVNYIRPLLTPTQNTTK